MVSTPNGHMRYGSYRDCTSHITSVRVRELHIRTSIYRTYGLWCSSPHETFPSVWLIAVGEKRCKVTDLNKLQHHRGKQVLRLPHYDCSTSYPLAQCSFTFWSSLQSQCPIWMRPRISPSDRIALVLPHYVKRLVRAVVRLGRLVVALTTPMSLVSCFGVMYWLVVIDKLYGRLLSIRARAPCVYFLFLSWTNRKRSGSFVDFKIKILQFVCQLVALVRAPSVAKAKCHVRIILSVAVSTLSSLSFFSIVLNHEFKSSGWRRLLYRF